MTIRQMQPHDLNFCLECVKREGWLSETRATFECFLNHDPLGCFVAEDAGRSIGMIVATPYDSAGFLGELIVVPDMRGRGLGKRLMEHAIKYLHEQGCGSVYLDGDTLAVPLYERLGFKTVCRSLRFVGRVEPQESRSVRAMRTEDLDLVASLDRAAFGEDRSALLRFRFDRFPELCLVTATNDAVAGYIMGQPGHGVVTVGPWYVSEYLREPLDLLSAMACLIGDLRLRLGVLESNESAVGLMRSLATFEETEPSWRMVHGPDSGLGASYQLYAIGSPAKG